MTFFNASEPLVRCKQEHLDVQDCESLLRLHWQIGNFTVFSGLYTRIDQTFLLWGLVTAGIFFYRSVCPYQLEHSGDCTVSSNSNCDCGNGCFDFVLGKSRAS